MWASCLRFLTVLFPRFGYTLFLSDSQGCRSRRGRLCVISEGDARWTKCGIDLGESIWTSIGCGRRSPNLTFCCNFMCQKGANFHALIVLYIHWCCPGILVLCVWHMQQLGRSQESCAFS